MSNKRVVYVRQSGASSEQVAKVVAMFADYARGYDPATAKMITVDADLDLPVWDFGLRRGTLIAIRELDEARTLLGYYLPGDNRCFIVGFLVASISRWHVGEWRQWSTAEERERMRR